MRESDTVRLTETHWNEFSFFKIKKYGGNDQRFLESIGQLNFAFIKKTTDNKRFNDIEQNKKSNFTHFFYELTSQFKKFRKEETLLWNYFPPDFKYFYGFEDPTFSKDEIMIGSIITHEPIIILCLTDTDKQELIRAGANFD